MNLNVNDLQEVVPAEWQGESLLDVLREALGLVGAKFGCGVGTCGACTVLVDGKPTRSCVLPVRDVGTRAVLTVEGLATGPKPEQMQPLQTGFWEAHGLQCGFCTPGILMTMDAWLAENPNPTEAAVREALSGTICRCTGYTQIVVAVMDVARQGDADA